MCVNVFKTKPWKSEVVVMYSSTLSIKKFYQKCADKQTI